MSDQPTMKPCPFCGSSKDVYLNPHNLEFYAMAGCHCCGIRTSEYWAGDEKAVAAWNRRAAPVPEPERKPLTCPNCERRHVDRGEWAERLHHTHLCEHCGCQWRVEPYAFGIEPVPVPAASDRERAGAFLKTKLRMYNFDPAHFYTGRDVDDLAAEFAAVREEAEERGYSRGHDMGMDKAYGVSIPVNHKSFEQYLDEAREAATRAERERCAVIAGTFAEGENEPEFVHALKIEAAIRSGKGE